MAKHRYFDTRFWSDNFIANLNPLERYLFLYFLLNEHTNICGIYELPLKIMAFETGIDIEMLPKMLKRFEGKVEYINGWVWVVNFIKHQDNGSKDIIKGIENCVRLAPKEVQIRVEEHLKKK